MSKSSKRLPSPDPVTRNVALCYIRISFLRRGEDPVSPERQKANIAAYCKKRGWVPEWYEDVGGHRSGRSDANRPELKRMYTRLGDPDVIAVVANEISRIWRKSHEQLALIEECMAMGIEVQAAIHEINWQERGGSIAVKVQSVFDEYYAEEAAIRQRDHARYRREMGITNGMAPFGTVRGKDRYLIPDRRGAWLLPDGTFFAGERGDPPPTEHALWRGYYECAQRVLEIYSSGNDGYEDVAVKMNEEGWAFRDRTSTPRYFVLDDVRRIVSNWREYAGFAMGGKAKDKNASMIESPVSILDNPTGREVFPLELIRNAATKQATRSITTKIAGTKSTPHFYWLSGILYCAHCEHEAERLGDPKLRNRITGHTARHLSYYRHTEGRRCYATNRSVPLDVLHGDIERLIRLLIVKPYMLQYMTELSIRSEYGESLIAEDKDFDKKRTVAIAKLKQRIKNNFDLCRIGEVAMEEYQRVKEKCEREISYWESRTTDTRKIALELQTCLAHLAQMIRAWETSSDEDKQAWLAMFFEKVVYDLDSQKIETFQLKPWADRFLVLRAALYAENHKPDPDDDPNPSPDGNGGDDPNPGKGDKPAGKGKNKRGKSRTGFDGHSPIGARYTHS